MKSDVKMFEIQVQKVINLLISLFYRIGLWQRGDEATAWGTRLKIFYSIYYSLFPISLMAGALSSDNKDEFVFAVEVSLISTVLLVKILYIIWRKQQILDILCEICVFSVQDEDEFKLANDKMKRFVKIINFFCFLVILNLIGATFVIPFISSEKSFFFNFGFPFDWKNNEIAYWVVFTFNCTELILTACVCFFAAFIWYLIVNCALRYEILGCQIKKIGIITTNERTVNKGKNREQEKQKLFLLNLVTAIESQKRIMKYSNLYLAVWCGKLKLLIWNRLTEQLSSFLSPIFAFQTATSAMCICCTIYCLAFVSFTFVECYGHLILIGICLFRVE